MRNLRMVTLVLVVLGLSAGPAVGAEPVGVGSDRVTYYLALGDSLAAGYQPIGREEDDRKTRMGYADQLWLMARHAYPDLQLVNLGCPGANTQTITEIDPRCQYENGSQLDEALAIIKEHQQELAFITIDIGFNDFECEDMSCLFPGIDGIAERLPPILATLQEAAPGVPVVGMNIYDPFLILWFEGDKPLARQSVVAIQIINEALAEVYGDAGIPVADVESAFAIDDWETMVPWADLGTIPRNVALLCERTWMCAAPPLGPDRHPNVLGFRVMAEAFAEELGLAR